MLLELVEWPLDAKVSVTAEAAFVTNKPLKAATPPVVVAVCAVAVPFKLPPVVSVAVTVVPFATLFPN